MDGSQHSRDYSFKSDKPIIEVVESIQRKSEKKKYLKQSPQNKMVSLNDGLRADFTYTAQQQDHSGQQQLSGRSKSARRNSYFQTENKFGAHKLKKLSNKVLPEFFGEEAEPQKDEKQFSGLQKERGKTAEFIQQGYWMQGEFVCFLTLDEANYVYIETFKFDSETATIEPFCEKVFLCDRSGFKKMESQLNEDRQLISVLLYNQICPDVKSSQFKGFVIDLRGLATKSTAASIVIRDINLEALTLVVDDRDIYDIQMSFSNLGHQTYQQELLILVDVINQPEFSEEEHFHLFGVKIAEKYTTDDEAYQCYFKELIKPMGKRNFHVVGFMHQHRNISLIVFEDGVIWSLDNENNAGIIHKCKLKMPFDRVAVCLFEPWHRILMLQSERKERIFYQQWHQHWAHKKVNIPGKYTVNRIIGNFAICSYNDGLIYLVEMNEDEMGMHVMLGDDTVWNYKVDVERRELSFLLQYEHQGKNFLWQKFDRQRQFHLTRPNCFEIVVDNTLVRVFRDGCRIEIKQELSRFEEGFYHFIPIDFEDLPIIVSSCTAIKIPGSQQIMLLVIPKPQVVKWTIKKQYLIIVDKSTLKAYECETASQTTEILSKVFFYSSNEFLGQIKVNSVLNRICKYEIISVMSDSGLKYQIKQKQEDISVNMRRITAFAFDSTSKTLLCMRERRTEANEQFYVYMLNLKKQIQPQIKEKLVMSDVDITEVAEIATTFKVQTQPISVFQEQEMLTGAASYIESSNEVYALIGNAAFSLLYRADLNNPKSETLFEQIITIKQAKELAPINNYQFIAISNTQAVIFRKDPQECADVMKYFQPENTELQCKRLIGRNIDIKLDFAQTIHSMSCSNMIIALAFGVQSVLLEFDDLQRDQSELLTQVTNLNDLVAINKQLLRNQYMMDGYIHITEDQGQWDSENPMLPVVLKGADFVTLFQDADGNQGCDESALVKNLYFLDYNIFESLIRDGMLQGQIPITHDQLKRFLTPVMTDHNNNLLHHFSYNHLEELQTIIEMPGFENYFNTEKKMFPIFYNFFGETQINIALLAHDEQSFYILLETMIKMQACVESSFLVNNWLLHAFEEGLDIADLLDSQIIQTKLTQSIVEHWSSWPEFHKMTDGLSVNYENPFLVLMHDESAYKNLFGEDFPIDDSEQEAKLFEKAHGDDVHEKYPIFYYAERLPVFAKDEEEQYENIFKLLEILSETDQLAYFRCGFVTRLIDWMWDSQLVKFYNLVSGCYLTSYALIVTASLALRWWDAAPVASSQVRLVMLALNLLILCLSLTTFEVKSMLEDGLSYFSSIWNKNDMCLFFMSIVCFIQEIMNLQYQLRKQSGKDEQLLSNVRSLQAATNITDEIVDDAGPPEIDAASGFDYVGYYMDQDPHESIIRVCYSILIINTHVKTLNVLSFYQDVAFIIKAMQRVIEDIQGYAFFFFFLVMMYAFAFNALDLVWYNSDAMYPEGDYVGMDGMVFTFFATTYRNSLGDNILNTFRTLPDPIKKAAWFVFLTQLILMFFLLLNFAIQIAEGGYNSVSAVQIEEMYKKKCGVICELQAVFGGIAKRKPTNIIITRECIQHADYNADIDETANGVKKQQASNKIDTLKSIDHLQRTIAKQNNRVNKEVSDIIKLLKKRLQVPPVVPQTHAPTSQKRTQSAKQQTQQEIKIEDQHEKPELIDKVLEGNLSSYRTSNIEYGSYGEDSYFSEY